MGRSGGATVQHSWRVSLAMRARRVERRLGRGLTDEEWERFERIELFDPMLLRSVAHGYYCFGVRGELNKLDHAWPHKPPLRYVARGPSR